MKKNKAVKGQFGYIKKKRQNVIIWTILLFALALGIFGIGLWSTGTKKNMLSIVAILGCLPACKSMVNVIMFMKAKGCSNEIHKAIASHVGTLVELYDLLFTSYDKNYQVSHIVVSGQVVCGFTEDEKCDEQGCAKHLEQLLKKGGCKNITVKIFDDLEKYCEGLDNLNNEASVENEQLDDIVLNLLAISL